MIKIASRMSMVIVPMVTGLSFELRKVSVWMKTRQYQGTSSSITTSIPLLK